MRLVVEVDGVRHQTDLIRTSAGVTIAQVVAQASGIRPVDNAAIWVDDAKHVATDLVSEVRLLEGSRLATEPAPVVEPLKGWTVTRSGGLLAGAVVAVPARRPLTVGRSPQADITIDSPSTSWAHLVVAREGSGVRVRDEGSTNGTFVNGVKVEGDGVVLDDEAIVVAGGTSLIVRPRLPESPAPRPGSLHNVSIAGTVPFNRPPRPGLIAGPEPLQPPRRKEVAPASKFNIIATVGPVIAAAAMVVMMNNLAYAAVALLSPALGIATWYDQKRRAKKESAGEDSRFVQTFESFRVDFEAAADAERRRRVDLLPDPATMLRRATLPATTLWQRRHGSPDFLTLHGGIGDAPWTPPVERPSGVEFDEDVQQLIDQHQLASSPVAVELGDAGVVGIVGNREDSLAVARSLLTQAATHCGPADLTIAVCCDSGREEAWEWAVWLPHVRRTSDGGADLWVSSERARSDGLLRALRDGIDEHSTPAVLLVLDSDVLLEGRDSAARALLGHGRSTSGTSLTYNQKVIQVSGIVVASSEEQLPASCTVVISAGEDAAGTISRPHDRAQVDDVILAGLDAETARTGAIDLARFEDPETASGDVRLPAVVRLNELLGLEKVDGQEIAERWASTTGISTPIGVGEKGVFSLDLVHDGPHGLVGGTTGSGKSEFLRSLVAGLAASVPPTKLTFILMDFKGGAAFATCERLPHTIGTVSNLDEQMADRALRALEAEMEYRQRVFAEAGEGVDNLDAYLATDPDVPMPRLLLVVDEFAMLAKDYPDVLTSLVSVAAVGRTLGVHMILATQRPAGVVNDDILANTNLRGALRVQSREDSMNVIGVPEASAIGRGQRGRSYIKLGQDDISPVQTAWSTGPVQGSDIAPVETRPVVFGRPPAPPKTKSPTAPSNQTELDVLIDAIVAASAEAGHAAPRPVWPEPLEGRVALDGFIAGDTTLPSVGGVAGAAVTFALSDDPDRQRQIPAAWDMDRGNLLLAGIPGSGTSTAMSSIALTLARSHAPADLDLLILDMSARDLAPLGDLPHAVGYVGAGAAAREQQVRLLKHVRGELDRRRAKPGTHPKLVVFIDGLAALRDEYQDFEGMQLLEGLYRAYAEGPDAGIHFVVTTTRVKAVPSAIDEVTTQKWLFHLADRYDYSGFGIQAAQIPATVAGRCVLVESRLQTHVATPDAPIEQAVRQIRDAWGVEEAKPNLVGQLPVSLSVRELAAQATIGGEPWRLPVGLRETDLEPGFIDLYEGENLLIAGPVRSGKSSLLLALAESARSAEGAVEVWGVCGRRSPLANSDVLDRVAVGAEELPAMTAAARIHRGDLIIMIDDAEQFDDADHTIADLLQANRPGLRLFAAGRADDLRTLYNHWTKTLRKARAGVLLQPDLDYDGDLLGVKLPRTSPVAMTPGRGYACAGGTPVLIQAALPSE